MSGISSRREIMKIAKQMQCRRNADANLVKSMPIASALQPFLRKDSRRTKRIADGKTHTLPLRRQRRKKRRKERRGWVRKG